MNICHQYIPSVVGFIFPKPHYIHIYINIQIYTYIYRERHIYIYVYCIYHDSLVSQPVYQYETTTQQPPTSTSRSVPWSPFPSWESMSIQFPIHKSVDDPRYGYENVYIIQLLTVDDISSEFPFQISHPFLVMKSNLSLQDVALGWFFHGLFEFNHWLTWTRRLLSQVSKKAAVNHRKIDPNWESKITDGFTYCKYDVYQGFLVSFIIHIHIFMICVKK